MPGYYCAVRGCTSKTGEAVSLFRFPKNYQSAKVWLEACNRCDLLSKIEEVYKNYRLCERHFDDKYIFKGNVKKNLVPRAVPTKFSFKKRQQEVAESKEEASSAKVYILLDVKGPPRSEKASLTSHPSSSKLLLGDASTSPVAKPLSPPFIAVKCTTSRSSPTAGLFSSTTSGATDSVASTSRATSPASPLLSPTTSTQAISTLSRNTPRKQKLRAQIRRQRRVSRKTKRQEKKVEKLEDFTRLCDIFLSKSLSEIVKNHVNSKNKYPLYRRYSYELNQFALRLYFLSPRAYGYISKLLTLPTKSNLQRITQQITCKPGLENDVVYKALEIKIKTMFEQDKHCMLCIAEMPLKSNLYFDLGQDEIIGYEDIGDAKKGTSICKNALVIMARSLYSSWQQPIGFFFVTSQLEAKNLISIIEKCILTLSKIDLHVEGILSDMSSNFFELAKLLGVTPENSEFALGGRKLVYIFDPCHLIKATRNNLLKYSFHFRGKKTSWSFIKEFYEQDKKQLYRCAPKLTNSHISPSKFEKVNVSLAAQVLSHSVACGMNTYASLNALSADSIGTIETIGLFNNLFDILNSISLRNPPDEFKNIFDGSKFQTDFFAEALEYLKELKIFNSEGQDISKKVKFHKCWIVTANSVVKLWDKLRQFDFIYLKTRRLNTDCIEHFFGSIRQQSGNNPTPVQFQRAFRKLFCRNYIHSNHMTSREDLHELLVNFDIPNAKEIFIRKNNSVKAIDLPDNSYTTENIPTENAFNYVCGYIIKKALEIHSCEICISFGKDCEALDISNLLTDFSAHNTDKSFYGSPQSAAKDFINFVYKMEHQFNATFDKISTREAVSNILFNIMSNITFSHPCPQFPINYIKKLFVRMKIFYSLRFTNRELKSTTGDKKAERKLKILSHI